MMTTSTYKTYWFRTRFTAGVTPNGDLFLPLFYLLDARVRLQKIDEKVKK